MDRGEGGSVPADIGDRPRGGASEPGGPGRGAIIAGAGTPAQQEGSVAASAGVPELAADRLSPLGETPAGFL